MNLNDMMHYLLEGDAALATNGIKATCTYAHTEFCLLGYNPM
jgi:hypothetical protein